MSHRVVFAPETRDDLLDLYDLIADRAGPMTAFGYVERLRTYCLGLADFPDHGRRRDDLRPGLRTIGFERRVLIAFHVMGGLVTIDRVLHGGRDPVVLAADEA